MQHSVDAQLSSVHGAIFLSLLQPLAAIILKPVSGVSVPQHSKHHHHCELPFHHNPRKFLLIYSPSKSPPAWMQLVYAHSPSNTQSALFIGLQIRC